jgi:hypothetical protein
MMCITVAGDCRRALPEAAEHDDQRLGVWIPDQFDDLVRSVPSTSRA